MQPPPVVAPNPRPPRLSKNCVQRTSATLKTNLNTYPACEYEGCRKVSSNLFLKPSRTIPGVQICNACKQYEYKNKKLIPRNLRRANSGRNQKNTLKSKPKIKKDDPVAESGYSTTVLNNETKYRGVVWYTKTERWIARRRFEGGKTLDGGYYDKEEIAAVASDQLVHDYRSAGMFGDISDEDVQKYLNFPNRKPLKVVESAEHPGLAFVHGIDRYRVFPFVRGGYRHGNCLYYTKKIMALDNLERILNDKTFGKKRAKRKRSMSPSKYTLRQSVKKRKIWDPSNSVGAKKVFESVKREGVQSKIRKTSLLDQIIESDGGENGPQWEEKQKLEFEKVKNRKFKFIRYKKRTRSWIVSRTLAGCTIHGGEFDSKMEAKKVAFSFFGKDCFGGNKGKTKLLKATLQATNGQYWKISQDHILAANSKEITENCVFEIIPLGAAHSVAIRSCLERYLCAEADGRISADREMVMAWEIWEMQKKGAKFCFKSHHGRYLTSNANGILTATKIDKNASTLFEVFDLEREVSGVSFDSVAQKWLVEKCVDGKTHSFGEFESKEKANAKAIELFGKAEIIEKKSTAHGVTWDSDCGSWKVHRVLGGKMYFGGLFESEELAKIVSDRLVMDHLMNVNSDEANFEWNFPPNDHYIDYG